MNYVCDLPVVSVTVHSVVNDDIDDLNDVDSEKSGQQSNHVYSLLDTNSRDNEMSE